MAEFILFDKQSNTARKFNSDDWFLGCVEAVKAENPRNAVIPVSDAEPKARYVVFFGSPALDKALAKVKEPGDIQGVLTNDAAVAGYVHLDTLAQA